MSRFFQKNLRFQGQPVGGLSALVFDESTREFLALSDDKRNHRFYKFQISPTPGTRGKKEKAPSALPSTQGRNRLNISPPFQLIPQGTGFPSGKRLAGSEPKHGSGGN